MTPKSSTLFPILFMTVHLSAAPHPEQWTIPIVSDEHGILCFGDPFEQNETTQEHPLIDKPQPTDELLLSAEFYQQMDVELPKFHVSQPQAIKTLLTDQDIESFSADLSEPVYTLMSTAEVHQNMVNPQAHQQEVPSTLSQETAVMDMNIESRDMDLGTLLAYGDLGPLSVKYISTEALSFDAGMESPLNDTYQIGNALMNDVKHQPNTSDSLTHQQTTTTFSNSINKTVRNVDRKIGKNMACSTFSDSGSEFGTIRSTLAQSFDRSGNFKDSFLKHTSQKPFQCDICSKQFSTSSDYQKHRRTHTGEKPFQCDICQKKFSDQSNCHKHRRKHMGEKPFQCDIGLNQFRTLSDYKAHRRTHTGEKPFQCDICPKQFHTSSGYKAHRRTHTEEKSFQCDICPKQFRTSSDYQMHRRTHTGEKPFQCEVCPKQFSTSSNYHRHRRTHSGEKPFRCDICLKKFPTSYNYQTHRRTHTGEKSYICYWCNQDYCSKRNLIRHVRKCSSRNVSYTADPEVSHFINSGTRKWTYMQ